MELRKLTSKDIFPMSRIISKIGISEFKNCFESDSVKAMIGGAGKGEDISATVGFAVMLDVGGIILSNLPSCEKEIYAFLAEVSGQSVKELQAVSMAEFAETVIELVQKEEFKDFFKVVSRLFNTDK